MSTPRSQPGDGPSRPPVATIGELPCRRITISAETPVLDVERLFLTDTALSAVTVTDEESGVACISRDWFFAQLVGPLGHGRSLYARHRVSRMPVPESLILPDAASPLEAAGRVQDRPVESRYHDVVVSFHDGSYGTLVVADLFAEVAYTHEYLAVHDSLTGLGNRALFLNHLRGAHARSANPEASRYGVLFVDLDGFKPINDVLGHDAGDTALRVVAQRLRSFESDDVTVARFGGDEFGLLVEHVESQETLTSLAAQINRKLENPVAIGDESIKLAASVGVALADRDSAPEENLRNADMAMYAAKRERSGTYAVYESAMHTRATRHLYMRSELQAALDHNEFEVFFQPACTLADAHVTSVEALVRWRHPDRGLTLPGQFIPMCERTGLIVPLGSWVLREACEISAQWRRAHSAYADLMVAVNISPEQVTTPGFVNEVSTVLETTGVNPSSLVLEVTENVLIEDFDSVRAVLDAIRGLGVHLAMDDFGSGFASLGYLSRLPVDILKIDRSLVAELGKPHERGLLKGVINLVRSLGLATIAEGIETAEQLRLVAATGCDQGQGYLFTKPLNSTEMGAYLERSLAQAALLRSAA